MAEEDIITSVEDVHHYCFEDERDHLAEDEYGL
jgi:hypothetical protein